MAEYSNENEKHLKSLILDTSSLMNNTVALKNNRDKYKYIILSTVASELDNLKESDNRNKSFKARRGLRFIEAYEDELIFVISDDYQIGRASCRERV